MDSSKKTKNKAMGSPTLTKTRSISDAGAMISEMDGARCSHSMGKLNKRVNTDKASWRQSSDHTIFSKPKSRQYLCNKI